MEWAKIDDKTYQYDEGGVRFFLLLGDKEALLIDSGMQTHNAKELAEEITNLPVSFYPANKRYTEVEGGGMTCIPFNDPATKGEISLVYSEKYYKSIPAYRDLVEMIKGEADSFLTK